MSETIIKSIDWAHKLPSHWDVIRIKYIADPNQSNSFMDGDWIESPYITDEGIRYLTSGNIGDGIYKEQGSGHISEDTFVELNCKYAYPGDLVFSRLNAPFGRACILPSVEDRYVLAVDNVIVRTRKEYDKHFVCYVSQCDEFHMKASELAKGTAMRRISRTQLGDMSIPMPPLPEQQSIVHYLDSKCSAIDEAIERHKKIIEKLEEYRGAEIARLVSFKAENNTYETGNTWFPTLPYGMSISRVGMHFDVTLGKMLCPKQRDENDTLEKYYCAGDIHFDGINQSNLKEMWFSPNEKRLYEVSNDDLLIVEGGAGAGNAFIVRNQEEKVYIQNSVLRIRGSETGSVRYLRYLIEHLVKNGYIAYACNTATFSHFTKDKVSGTPFPVSSFELQEKIADQIDSIDATVRSAQKKHEAVIEKLEEYRKSIIYNAVTGKIDCREAVK